MNARLDIGFLHWAWKHAYGLMETHPQRITMALFHRLDTLHDRHAYRAGETICICSPLRKEYPMTKQHAIFTGDPINLSKLASHHLLMDRAFGTLNALELDTFYIKAFHALDHEDGLVMDHATFWRHDREDAIYLQGPDPEND